jgi:type IV secretory pathway VirB10-like protein
MVVEQPHFDDERTVLSAQPVVPLERIETKVRQRRRWFLGSAFVVAMLLGAASALVSAYFKLRNAPEPEVQTLSITDTSSVVPSFPDQSLESSLPVVESTPTPRPRNTDRATRVAPPVVEPPLRDEEDELRRIRDAVLVDEWQERRQRRAERRERRRAQHPERDSERDLSNLDEIFEGRRRP